MRERIFSQCFNNISNILKKDFNDVFKKNKIVVIVLIAIVLLPSLYALLNIQACWDPYENTGDLDFAIANEDLGSNYDGKTLDIGDDLVTDLKNNTNFNWVFVNESTLREGVKNGTYYAGIIIPKNFSKDVLSITSNNPNSAHLEYMVNRKTNPMASKLSASAAKEIYNKMNAKIVSFIDVAAYGKLGDLQAALSSGSVQLSSGAIKLQSGAGQVSSGAGAVQSGAGQVSSGANAVQKGASDVKAGANKLSQGSAAISQGSSKVSGSASKIENGASQIQAAAGQLSGSVDVGGLPSEQLKQVVNGSLNLANKSSDLAGASSNLAKGSTQLAGKSSELANGASSVAGGASSVADGASSVAGGSQELANGALSLAAGSKLLANSAAYALFSASSSLAGASNSLEEVTGVDENNVGDYIYSPVTLDEHELYPVNNYGSEVAPFYIVLSMWVGALITCVMLRIGQSTGTDYSPSEMYFGKLLIFLVMALLETSVTLIGAFCLGIDISNPVMFIFSAYFVSLIFMLICYSLVSALGHVGKGVAVILLVFQISGTGGIYPIQLMDSLFGTLYPYLPMTHGINLLRESALGLLWSNYIPSFVTLVFIGILTLIVSVLVKMYADKRAHWFEEKLNETDLF